jgi:hypothetical protein
LGAFDGFLEALEEELEVFAALDEIDVGCVDDEEVGGCYKSEDHRESSGAFGLSGRTPPQFGPAFRIGCFEGRRTTAVPLENGAACGVELLPERANWEFL